MGSPGEFVRIDNIFSIQATAQKSKRSGRLIASPTRALLKWLQFQIWGEVNIKAFNMNKYTHYFCMLFMNNRIYREILNIFVGFPLKNQVSAMALLYDNTIDIEYYTRYNASIK